MVVEGNFKRYVLRFCIVLFIICFSVSIVAAMNNTNSTITNIPEEGNVSVVNDSYIDFYNKSMITVQENDKLYTDVPVISMKAKPSCGCRYSYKYWYNKRFVNYCPKCHHYGCLKKNPKMVYEKEYTCGICDSDFCGVCGKEKYSWSNCYLQKW